jgi:hypothetical protein
MKPKRIGLCVLILIVLSALLWFIWTRFCVPAYELKENGKILSTGNSVYIRNDFISASDEEGIGRTIGIAIEGKREITDYITPYWVMEYNNDKEHTRIFVRGFMDSGGVYRIIEK